MYTNDFEFNYWAVWAERQEHENAKEQQTCLRKVQLTPAVMPSAGKYVEQMISPVCGSRIVERTCEPPLGHAETYKTSRNMSEGSKR